MTNEELLVAISSMLDAKLDPLIKRMDRLEERMDRLEERMDRLEERMDSLEFKVKKINIQIENQILPVINDLHSCFMDSCKKFNEQAEHFEALQIDNAVLKNVVADHSERLAAAGL